MLFTRLSVSQFRINKIITGLYYKMLVRFFFDKILSEIRYDDVFNKEDYLNDNHDVNEHIIDPLLHYLLYGRLENRFPGLWFHECFFIEQNGKVRSGFFALYPWIFSKKNTFYRRTTGESVELIRKKTIPPMICTRQQISREIITSHYKAAESNPDYEKDIVQYVGHQNFLLMAFYKIRIRQTGSAKNTIPDFPGWHQVAKALPLFPGHNQPRIPGELGFYDARLPEIFYRQEELAKQAGITGFCFDLKIDNTRHFEQFITSWLNKRIKPGSKFTFRFLLDEPSNLDLVSFCSLLNQYISQNQIINIEGKPAFIFRFPYYYNKVPRKLESFRNILQRVSGANSFLMVELSSVSALTDNVEKGADAILAPPFYRGGIPDNSSGIDFFNDQNNVKIAGYKDIIRQSMDNSHVSQRVYRQVIPAWDESPVRKNPLILSHSAPELYGQWLSAMAKWTIGNHSENQRVLFINSWNDWNNGCFIEPDKTWGYGFLNATARAMNALHQS